MMLTRPFLSLAGVFAAGLLWQGSASVYASSPPPSFMLFNRVGFGLQAGDFFAASSGFVAGSTSHTNVACFDDGTFEVCYDMTIEGFDADGNPAALRPNNQAVAIEVGVGDAFIDAGESIKITFNTVNFDSIGPPPFANAQAMLSSIGLAAFEVGTDTFTYTGLGAGSLTGDDMPMFELGDTPITPGSSFTITADTGRFRLLYVSVDAAYSAIPEPASFGLLVAALGMTRARRRS